jgi:plasmid stability protein
MTPQVYLWFTMGTVAAKLPDDLETRLRRRAKAEGKTTSQVVREAVEEHLAPPSQEWAQALLRLPKVRPRRSTKPPKGVDELTYRIDTTF